MPLSVLSSPHPPSSGGGAGPGPSPACAGLTDLASFSGSVTMVVLGVDALRNSLAGGLLPFLFFKSIFAEGQTDCLR